VGAVLSVGSSAALALATVLRRYLAEAFVVVVAGIGIVAWLRPDSPPLLVSSLYLLSRTSASTPGEATRFVLALALVVVTMMGTYSLVRWARRWWTAVGGTVALLIALTAHDARFFDFAGLVNDVEIDFKMANDEAVVVAGLFIVFSASVLAILPLFTGAVARFIRYRADKARRARRADESARLAGELHELVGNQLAALHLAAGGAIEMWDRDPAQSRQMMREMSVTASDALTHLRRLVGIARSAPLAPSPPSSST
jgi:signal transduction histidine kinase